MLTERKAAQAAVMETSEIIHFSSTMWHPYIYHFSMKQSKVKSQRELEPGRKPNISRLSNLTL